MKIKAAVQNSGSGELSLCNIELEEPRADEVLVKIVACGICHTDIMMQHSNGNLPFRKIQIVIDVSMTFLHTVKARADKGLRERILREKRWCYSVLMVWVVWHPV